MTDTIAIKSAKVSIPIPDGAFPRHLVPAKGLPGSGKARVPLRLRTPEGLELRLEPAAKNVQKLLDSADEAPGGFFVAQGKLGPDGLVLEGGLIYQRPAGPKPVPDGLPLATQE